MRNATPASFTPKLTSCLKRKFKKIWEQNFESNKKIEKVQNSRKVVADPNKVSRKTFFVENRKKNFGNNFFLSKCRRSIFFTSRCSSMPRKNRLLLIVVYGSRPCLHWLLALATSEGYTKFTNVANLGYVCKLRL